MDRNPGIAIGLIREILRRLSDGEVPIRSGTSLIGVDPDTFGLQISDILTGITDGYLLQRSGSGLTGVNPASLGGSSISYNAVDVSATTSGSPLVLSISTGTGILVVDTVTVGIGGGFVRLPSPSGSTLGKLIIITNTATLGLVTVQSPSGGVIATVTPPTGLCAFIGASAGSGWYPLLYSVASQSEAQTGAANDRLMTPLRTAQAIAALAATGVPSGTVTDYAGTTAPTGWLLCDGSAVSRSTYSALFTAISTTYGAGDGSTTFNVPDVRGRVSVGAGAGSGLTSRTLGSSSGSETHALTGSESPSHTHSPVSFGSGDYTAYASGTRAPVNATTYTANGAAHNNMQPFLVLNKIIKT